MSHQEELSVVATIKAGHTEAVEHVLGTIAAHVDDWNVIPFADLRGVHFGRLVVYDEDADLDGQRFAAQLALMNNIDGPVDAHVRELATVAASGLDEIFSHCEGYPDAGQRTPETRAAFLRRNSVRSQAFYVNRQGRTVEQIRKEEELRRAINDFLDSADLSREPPEKIRRAIVDFVRGSAPLRWALRPAEGPGPAWELKELMHLIGGVMAAIVLAPLLVILAPLLVLLLRWHEKRDVPDTSHATADTVQRFRADEDYWVHNQVVAAGLFKPGWFRKFLAFAILKTTDYACRHIYDRGSLSGLNTIHFARWTPLDTAGRRLSFSSNYDGSLESYMNDFIDKAAWGLNAIFSNGDGFPRTCLLFCGGIRDEKAYKRFLPTRQVQSRVWYSAYPHLSTKNIANNAAIRKGLSDRMTDDETAAWLARFGVGNELPASGLVARMLDGFPWDRLCRRCN